MSWVCVMHYYRELERLSLLTYGWVSLLRSEYLWKHT